MNKATTVQPLSALGRSPFAPLRLLATTLLLWLGFQSYQLLGEREQLATARVAQNPQVEAAGKVRVSPPTVATATARLAYSGNANARSLVEELRQRGITINPAAPRQTDARAGRRSRYFRLRTSHQHPMCALQ